MGAGLWVNQLIGMRSCVRRRGGERGIEGENMDKKEGLPSRTNRWMQAWQCDESVQGEAMPYASLLIVKLHQKNGLWLRYTTISVSTFQIL